MTRPSLAGPSRVPSWAYVLLHVAFLALPFVSILSALIMLGLGCYLAWRPLRVELPVPFKSWSLLMVAVGLSAATSVAPALSWIAVLLFLGYFAVLYVVGLMLDTPDRVWSLVRNSFWMTVFCAACGVVFALGHLYWYYQAPGIELRLGFVDHRAASFFYHPNILSAYLILATGLGMMLLLQQRGRARVMVGAGLAVVMLCQVLTATRSGWIGTLVLLVLLGLTLDRRILVALLGGSTLALLGFWGMIVPRLQTLAQLDFGSNLHRMMVWQSAMAMIAARPLTGWGPGTWPLVYPRFEHPDIVERMPHAHNFYLMIGAEFGLVVLVVLLGVFLSLVLKTSREMRGTPWARHVLVLGCTLVGYLVLGFFDFIFTEGRNSILFFGLLGLLVAMRRFRPTTVRATPRVLFLSNGFGEDRIAASLARRWPGSWEKWSFPVVGEGRALRSAGATPVAPLQAMPSGGFILRSPRALWRDLEHGLLGLTLRQLHTMRQLRGEVDLVVAVGDVVPLYFAWLSGAPWVFVGCAKSDHYLGGRFGSYGAWERWFIHHPRCLAIYPRDAITARNLSEHGFRAHDLGNPMLDDLEPGPESLGSDDGSLRVGLLPGSRDEAYQNMAPLLAACVAIARAAPERRPVAFFAAIAESLEVERLAREVQPSGWTLDARGRYLVGPQGVSVRLWRGAFGTWVHGVEVVVGMAGTANEQAVGLGLPVITFPGHGPQFNPAFAEAQTRLLGPSIFPVAPQPEAVARELWRIVGEPELAVRLQANGRERMGEPGASGRIVAHALACHAAAVMPGALVPRPDAATP